MKTTIIVDELAKKLERLNITTKIAINSSVVPQVAEKANIAFQECSNKPCKQRTVVGGTTSKGLPLRPVDLSAINSVPRSVTTEDTNGIDQGNVGTQHPTSSSSLNARFPKCVLAPANCGKVEEKKLEATNCPQTKPVVNTSDKETGKSSKSKGGNSVVKGDAQDRKSFTTESKVVKHFEGSGMLGNEEKNPVTFQGSKINSSPQSAGDCKNESQSSLEYSKFGKTNLTMGMNPTYMLSLEPKSLLRTGTTKLIVPAENNQENVGAKKHLGFNSTSEPGGEEVNGTQGIATEKEVSPIKHEKNFLVNLKTKMSFVFSSKKGKKTSDSKNVQNAVKTPQLSTVPTKITSDISSQKALKTASQYVVSMRKQQKNCIIGKKPEVITSGFQHLSNKNQINKQEPILSDKPQKDEHNCNKQNLSSTAESQKVINYPKV